MRRTKPLDVDHNGSQFMPWPEPVSRLIRPRLIGQIMGLLLAALTSLALTGLGYPISPGTLLLILFAAGFLLKSILPRLQGNKDQRRH